jgi:hypothetical protein
METIGVIPLKMHPTAALAVTAIGTTTAVTTMTMTVPFTGQAVTTTVHGVHYLPALLRPTTPPTMVTIVIAAISTRRAGPTIPSS